MQNLRFNVNATDQRTLSRRNSRERVAAKRSEETLTGETISTAYDLFFFDNA